MENVRTMNSKKSDTERLFNNPFLERMTRTHIAVPVSLFFIYGIGLLVWGLINTSVSIGLTIALFFVGWLVYSWVEYQIHRRIFHLPLTTNARKKFQYTVHGVHHDHPKDKDRLAMPPLLSITLGTIVLVFFKAIIGNFAFALVAGFLVGYGSYLLVHYVVHIFPPPKNIFRQLWINHSIHHYRDGSIIFGVSSPLWDYIYGTMGKVTKEEVNRARSETPATA